MNFGNIGPIELLFVLLVWGVPLLLLVWFVRTLAAMAASLRDIADRMGSVEHAIQQASLRRDG